MVIKVFYSLYIDIDLYIFIKKNKFALKDCVIYILFSYNGEMAERLNASVLKTDKGASPSWVRIPVSPPRLLIFEITTFKIS